MSERWEVEDKPIWFWHNFTDIRRMIKFSVNMGTGWFVRDNVTIPGADVVTGAVNLNSGADFQLGQNLV
jgi:hypothetical protein